MNKRKGTLTAVTILVVGLGAAWALGYFSEDPMVADARTSLEKMREKGERPNQEVRAKIEALTDAQRRQLFQGRGDEMRARMAERIAEFREKSPEEIQQLISDSVDKVVSRRADREQNSDGNDRGGRGDRPQRSEAEQDARRKQMLDRIPPEGRAVFTQLQGMVNKELVDKGEEPLKGREMFEAMRDVVGGSGGGPGGGGGGRGGPPR